MTKKLTFLLVFIMTISLLIGCGGGGGGGGGGAITNPTAADPTNPVVPGAPVGNSKISVSIKFPTLSIRPSASVTGNGTVLGKLYVNDALNQQKNATVNAGAVTLVFNGVPDTGTARVDLELTGCHINGVTKFTGSAAIGSDIVINVEPVYPAGALKSADGRVLTEIGTPNTLGYTTSDWRLGFNDLGQPIGKDYAGNVVNFTTGQNYFSVVGLKYEDVNISPRGILWYDGKFVLYGGGVLYQVSPTTGATSIFSGKRDVFSNTVDGATLDTATFDSVAHAQVIKGKLYLNGSTTQLSRLDGDTFKVITTPLNWDGFSITEDGEIFLLHYSDGVKGHVAKLIGTEPVIQSQFDDPAHGAVSVTNLIKYQDGYLYGVMDEIRFIKGTTVTTWLHTTALKSGSTGLLSVFKNDSGEIYVTSDAIHKIWKLN